MRPVLIDSVVLLQHLISCMTNALGVFGCIAQALWRALPGDSAAIRHGRHHGLHHVLHHRQRGDPGHEPLLRTRPGARPVGHVRLMVATTRVHRAHHPLAVVLATVTSPTLLWARCCCCSLGVWVVAWRATSVTGAGSRRRGAGSRCRAAHPGRHHPVCLPAP